MMKMANKGASVLLVFTIVLKATNTVGQLVQGKAEPAQYISFPPSTYDEKSYEVTHNIGNCTFSTVRIDNMNMNEEVITCPHGELLLDGITQTNLEDDVTDDDIWTFYTWEDNSIPINKAFVTLQFPNNIIPTKVVVYSLDMMELRAGEPRNLKLYSSSTESIYPEDEIPDVDDNCVVVKSGTTSENDDYDYIRCDLTISENVSLKYLRIELDFDAMSWIFLSEIEVYHFEPLPSTTSSSIMVSTTTTSAISSSIKTSKPLTTTTIPLISTVTSTLVTAHSSSTSITTFPTPVFVFPETNLALHLKTIPLDVTINCTVKWEGDSSQLTTMWFYNETLITGSQQKYEVAKSHLIIKQFTLQDVGTYECVVKNLRSGWNDSRQYYITTKDANPVEELEREDKFSNQLPIPIIIAAAAGSIGLLVLCLGLTICIIACHRKNKRERNTKRTSYLVTEEPNSFLHTFENKVPLEQRRKASIDSRYEKVNITETLTTKTSIKEADSGPPTVPRLPKKFKYSKRIPAPELPKLQGDYAFLSNYMKLERIPSQLVPDQISETYFDIYDDTVNTALTSIPQSPQDIYCEAFDYNHCHEEEDDNSLNMCVPIYHNPRPLTETEAPELFEWSNVSVVAKIGEGQFGNVYVVEASGINTDKLGHTESKTLAAVKTLKGDYSPYLKQQFVKEIKFMSRLNNANVIRLLGICNKGTPFIMMEYMSNGDLHMFLKKHYLPEIGKDTAESVIPIDSIILQYIALQIANGMRYLALYRFIHRDLAARNCLVGEDYVVKIADFGMTQDLYNESYFVMRGKAIVPIRWMAPECFFGKFSTKTDVWSYGVTLWETFTLCRKQPYHEMTDEELIIDVQKGRSRTLLKRPPSIPDEIYHVMSKCWLYDSKHRPDFESLYNQLFDFYMQHSQQ